MSIFKPSTPNASEYNYGSMAKKEGWINLPKYQDGIFDLKFYKKYLISDRLINYKSNLYT